MLPPPCFFVVFFGEVRCCFLCQACLLVLGTIKLLVFNRWQHIFWVFNPRPDVLLGSKAFCLQLSYLVQAYKEYSRSLWHAEDNQPFTEIQAAPSVLLSALEKHLDNDCFHCAIINIMLQICFHTLLLTYTFVHWEPINYLLICILQISNSLQRC